MEMQVELNAIETERSQLDWTSYRKVILKKNQVIGSDPQHPILLLLSGSVLISHSSADYDKSYSTLLRGPSILRMDLDRDVSPSKVSAILEPCEVIQISASEMTQLIGGERDRFDELLQLAFSQFRRLDQRADEILTKMDAELRLLSFLDYESRQHGVVMGNNCFLSMPLSHRQIADVIFACRQSVSSTLSNFRKLDLLAYDRKSFILFREGFDQYFATKRREHQAASISEDTRVTPGTRRHPIEMLPTTAEPKTVGKYAVA